MQTLESIRNRIRSAEELESVVKAMKALAAVSIRQYEKAVESLSDYSRTVELGLQVVLAQGLDDLPSLKPPEATQFGTVIFGSQQGLSGQFNSRIASFALSRLTELGVDPNRRRVMALGERVVPELEETGLAPQRHSPLPWSVAGITRAVQRTVMDIDEWRFREGIGEIVLFYHRQLSGASYTPTAVYLFPLDPEWLGRWAKRGWSSRTLPMYTMDRRTILSSLIRQHLFVTLFRAFAESLAAENASRLSSMQSAERNIKDRLGELSTRFQRLRQSSITSEILDIVSGFEALRETDDY